MLDKNVQQTIYLNKFNKLLGNILHKTDFTEAILSFFAIPCIMIIAFYLFACSIAPIVNLNNQTFKVIVTLTGGMPTLFFYFRNQSKN